MRGSHYWGSLELPLKRGKNFYIECIGRFAFLGEGLQTVLDTRNMYNPSYKEP